MRRLLALALGLALSSGGTAIGASAAHVHQRADSHTATASVTDHGGIPAGLSHGAGTRLHAHLLMLPQGLEAMVHRGLSLLLSSSERADAIITLSIPRRAARRAGLRSGRGASVTIGRGSVSGLREGVMTLHLHVPRTVARRLARLRSVTLTVHMLLIAAGGERLAIDAAGRY